MNLLRNSYKDKLIIWQPWGGLGDNLQFTTLPELAYKSNLRCFISSKNIYRNNEIFDLVWKKNPFICGISDEPPNAGITDGITNDGTLLKIPAAKQKLKEENNIFLYEYVHGFEPINKLPKLYYNPNIIENVKNDILLDLGIVSLKNNYTSESIKKILKTNYDIKKIKLLISKKPNIQNGFFISDIPQIQFNNIFEYCDLIYSCRQFVCLASGTNALSAALLCKTEKRPDILVAPNMPGLMSGSYGWKYESNNYIFI